MLNSREYKIAITCVTFASIVSTLVSFQLCDRRIAQRDGLIGTLQREQAGQAERLRAESDAATRTIEEWKQRALDCNTQRIVLEENARQEEIRDQWFTVVYEPGAPSPSPFAALDLVKPGLGALLGRMQEQQPPAMQARYIFRGLPQPIVMLPGSRLVRTQVPSPAVTQ